MRIELRRPVGTARIKRGCLVLRNRLHLAEHLARARLIETDRRIHHPDRLQQVHRPQPRDLPRRHRLVERHPHEALRRQVIHLPRPRPLEQADRTARIGEVVLHQMQVRMLRHAQFLQSPEIGRRRAPVRPENGITLLQQ